MAKRIGPHIAIFAGPHPCILLHTTQGLDEANWAECEWDSNARFLRVHPQKRGKSYTEVVIHEWLHALERNWEEPIVEKFSVDLCEVLWGRKSRAATTRAARIWMKANCPQFMQFAPQLSVLLWHSEVRHRAGLDTGG